jgi:hypothetical protein
MITLTAQTRWDLASRALGRLVVLPAVAMRLSARELANKTQRRLHAAIPDYTTACRTIKGTSQCLRQRSVI